MDIFLGSLLGAVLAYLVITYFKWKVNEKQTVKQSEILIQKIKSVCNLISVEGEFAEIYQYENQKKHFLKFITSKKKAVLLIKAKAHIGYDLTQIKLESKKDSKEIILTQFPEPKILSVETDVKYYDKKDGIFNKFKADDLTELNKEAKDFIIEKIPESGLITSAKKEALDSIQMIEKLLETAGWKFVYTNLVLPETKKKLKS
ncbi:DUF4230 domain-containing protein [Lutibacter holmesii]|uniref:DUF4230 domain-containing protein n=1 Tax=Lutibacter holmesii TaxID=1137985 RepID=A0ABW3WMY0_9FLAO